MSLLRLFVFVLVASVCFTAVSAGLVSVPAEYRVRQSGTWMGWPIFDVLPGESTEATFMEANRIITRSDDDVLFLTVTSEAQKRVAQDEIAAFNAAAVQANRPTIDLAKVRWVPFPRTDFWLRDYLLFGLNSTGGLTVVDFDFNAWGFGGEYTLPGTQSRLRVSNYFNSISNTDTLIAQRIASYLNVPLVRTWLRMEPGGLEFGDGVNPGDRKRLIISEAVILQPERNYGATKKQVHDELMRLFDLDDIIWLPKFYYDAYEGRERTLAQCPSDDSGPAHCNNPDSNYYVGTFGGGLVVDESPFSGALENIEPMSKRTAEGHADPIYDNVLTAMTTNGHTDEYVKWIGPNKVLLAEVPNGQSAPASSIDGRTWYRLEEIKRVLQSKGIQITRIPTAAEHIRYLPRDVCATESALDMFFSGGTYRDPATGQRVSARGVRMLSLFPNNAPVPFYSARSYLNHMVTDTQVIVPKYNDGSSRDQDAFNILTQAYADVAAITGITRTVIQVENIDRMNFCGGGLHCISQNQPVSLNGVNIPAQ